MIVNLNTTCKVQLNEFGKKIWLSQIEALPKEVIENRPDVVATLKNKIDANDCVELELWAIMNMFGPYLSDVQNPFRSTTIELNKNPDFGNFFKKDAHMDEN